jgi:hypothetical protein
MKQKLFTIPKRAVMTLLLAVFTVTSTWADSWPKYITEVVLFGIRNKDKDYYLDNYYTDRGYTVIKQDLIKGCVTYCDVFIYLAYKTAERASTDGGYITDFVILNTSEPPATWKYNGRTYHLCPADDHLDQPGIDYDGNLNFGVTTGWNLYLYYTTDDFADKRVVSSISFNDTQSGSVDGYEVSDKEWVYDIDLNKGAGGDDIYMHLTTPTKTNRPKTDPEGRGGLKYNGYYQHLMKGGEIESGEMWYQVDESYDFLPGINSARAQNAGTYKVSYYAGANEHGDQSETHSKTVTIGKSPNNHATVSCGPAAVGETPSPSVTENLSKGSITYLYSSTENGEYSETVPSAVGTWWVKATIAADSNCNEYTTAPVSFMMTNANLILAENADNSTAISDNNGKFAAATLNTRTLYKDGRWNTLCLPFSLASFTGTPLEGATVKTLSTSSFANGTLTMNFTDATSIEAGKPYIVKWEKKADFVIKKYSDWNALCITTQTHNLAGKTVVLTADVDGNVCGVMGSSSCPFKGTIDGQGHTLYFNQSSEGECWAPFAYVDGATIKNLRVVGTITTNHQFAAGLVGNSSGNTTISNCRSSIEIASTIEGDGTHGGLVGKINDGEVNISDCLFDGTLSGNKTTNCGGFVGWTESNNDATVNINRSLFNPTEVDLAGGCKTFARARQDASVNIYKGFYKTLLGEVQGTDANTMSIIQLGSGLGTNWEIIGGEFVPKMNDGAADMYSPVFSGVTIDNTLQKVETQYVDFVGSYDPVDIAGEDRSMLYLGANNKLYFPNAAMTVKAFRGYFKLKGIEAGDVTNAQMFFGDDENTTAIQEHESHESHELSGAWYTLSGVRLNAKPTAKGLYIVNGKKVMIK